MGATGKGTLLGYELDPKQDAYVNYLFPSVLACLLYILQFSVDLVLSYKHYSDEDPIWASLTLFFVYLPVMGCFIITISSWELWPEYEGCGWSNTKWALLKIAQHLFFPVWSMWRYAERIFWSIEGIRSEDEESRQKALSKVTAARTIELYFFLQGYLHTLPQILLQLHILMRNVNDLSEETVYVQGLSIFFNLTKTALTTTLFHRFKSQKLTGKQYPWLKQYKYPYCATINTSKPGVGLAEESGGHANQSTEIGPEDENKPSTSRLLERRRSSDLYLEPVEGAEKYSVVIRETSVVDGPPRILYTDYGADQVDVFGIPRLREIKGMLEDDAAGKTIAFFWWFCFLLGRILTISTFAYFYPTHIIWLLCSHFILVVALLLYDVRADQVRRAKAIFFIFIGLVYLFCLIEFKIKFKKTKFIYNGFFTLVFTENIIMCFIWWFRNLETIESDWWFKYVFCVIFVSTALSLLSMLFYLNINKPEKIVVATEMVKDKNEAEK